MSPSALRPALLLLAVLVLGAASPTCRAQARPRVATFFSQPRTFENHLFLDQKACDDYNASQSMWMNCTQSLAFSPGGQVRIIVTDIANMGSYSLDGNQVTVIAEGGDALPRMVFRVTYNHRNLVRVLEDAPAASPEVWELRQQ